MSLSAPMAIRTLLVSDVHLGCKHARTEEFLRFIERYRPDTLYLVGDFFDAWKINSGWHWNELCDRIVDHLIKLVDDGTRLLYTPGNHDSFLRQSAFQAMLPASFPAVKVADEFVFETLHGWRFLVTHGDLFDFFETKAQWISKGSSAFYDSCLSLNRWVQRRFLGQDRNPYGACAVVKGRVKRGVKFISRYENKIMQHASNRQCDGVICGHIHTPVIKQSNSILYCNTGDWVENCTGLIEHHDGGLQLVSRYGEAQSLPLPRRTVCFATKDPNSSADVVESDLAELAC
ncbi:UDP-2,3-diacylglucosamine diphosphatase [Stieleria sp. TO1_6]|uniref:UDP-2,3-diacylglucosamine diphosphatase n=1 Tax=Stieleria tagensis TaxID=2956795 RepID=UPI00209B6992|nr:UDP-2,3-diacylglucosamine diphosphatase [Stieleria tagensis]MCO8121213.1 UDP-2,3-diacylglucosamine diphosphatase [Stieleria tagensis]